MKECESGLKTRPNCMFSIRNPLQDTYKLKINGQRKRYHANTNQRKAGLVVLISGRANFKAREVNQE